MQAMEQTCSLDVESASLRLQQTPSIALSLSERNKVHFLCHLDTRPGQRQATDWLAAQLWFHCYYGGGWHTLCPCPLYYWGSSAFPTSCQRRGAKLRMLRQAIWASFLCLKPLSLTKSSCTCLTGTPDNSSASFVAYSFFACHPFYHWEMVSPAEKGTKPILVNTLSCPPGSHILLGNM